MTALLDEAGVIAMAEAMSKALTPGEVVWLSGELGAGKTTFVRALVRGLGAPAATSPTYSLVHRYPSPKGPVFHVDCYRLRNPSDARDLDWETLSGGAVLVIEWPERAPGWAPRPTRRITLAHTPNPQVRRVDVE